MKIKKILNQNAVLIEDQGQDKIAIGKGIGFHKSRNDLIFEKEVERMFIMEPESQMKLQNLLNQIDEKFLFAAERIIDHAETILMEKINEHVLISLTDHLSFSAENLKNGIIIRNKLLREIEVLHSEEFAVAQWAVEYLNDELGIPYSYDEAGYIAIHLHSGRSGQSDNHRSIREVTIISDIMHLIAEELGIDLYAQEMTLNYSRLATHLRLLLQRYQNQQYAVLDEEILDMVKEKYPASYRIARKVRIMLIKQHQVATSSEELGYIAIHIERLRRLSESKEKGEN